MARHSNQLTLRDVDPRVLDEIHRLARAEGLSVNKAAAKILRMGAGVQDAPVSRSIGGSVDRFVGSLSKAEAAKLSTSLRSLEQVDGELWK
jgi:hypothetical protein